MQGSINFESDTNGTKFFINLPIKSIDKNEHDNFENLQMSNILG